MQIPLEIVFDDFVRSESVEARIRQEINTLVSSCDQIASAQVTVARSPHRNRFFGTYQVRLHVMTPGKSDVSDKSVSPIVVIDDDIYMAVDEAFEIARRREHGASSANHQSTNFVTGTQIGIG